MVSIHRSGQRFTACGSAPELEAFALDKHRAGQPCRVNIRWDGSYHDPVYHAVVLFGPALREPMTESEIVRQFREAENRMVTLFKTSRKSW